MSDEDSYQVHKWELIQAFEVATHKLRHQIGNIERKIDNMSNGVVKTQADLDAAIAALPGQIQAAVDTALAPVIAAIKAKAAQNGVDFTSEVTSLGAVGGAVATSVATDIATTG